MNTLFTPNTIIYKPLASNTIRILELDAGNYADPIVARLVVQAIDQEPYEALSYVWGNADNPRDITINGTTVTIRANLHGALTVLRPQLLPCASTEQSCEAIEVQKKPIRRLWADAVCINQADLPERIAQVELMSRIYASARSVLSWLGWEESEEDRCHTQDAMRYISMFMKDPEANLYDARILLQHHEDLDDPAGVVAQFTREEQQRLEQQIRNWEAIKIFFDIEYFHRTWIVQELGLAREAILVTALKPASGETQDTRDDFLSHNVAAQGTEQDLKIDTIHWPLVGAFVKFMDYNGASLVTHLDLQSWVAHHTYMVWERKEDGTPDCDFLTGMHWTRILRVTDPRDRVFGVLGHPLATIDGELVIHPDYESTRGVVYTRLAANFIRKTKNLYIVNLVDHESDPSLEFADWDRRKDGRMPSWVPDWHGINRTTPVDYPVAAAAIQDADICIEGPVDGIEGTPLPHLLLQGWLVDEIAAVSCRMETTDFPITHVARERTKVNPFWLDRAWETICPEGASDSKALAKLESLSVALPLGTREQDDPTSKAGPNQSLEDHHRSFAAYVVQYHELFECALFEAERLGEALSSFLPMRSLLSSLPVDTQVIIRQRAEGVTSDRFIECMTWPAMSRVVFRTISGLVGMGSRVARPGDIICRVKGSDLLMTLRRIGDSDTNELLSPTILGAEEDKPIVCAFIAPAILPERIKRGSIYGDEFGEKAIRLRVV